MLSDCVMEDCRRNVWQDGLGWRIRVLGQYIYIYDDVGSVGQWRFIVLALFVG